MSLDKYWALIHHAQDKSVPICPKDLWHTIIYASVYENVHTLASTKEVTLVRETLQKFTCSRGALLSYIKDQTGQDLSPLRLLGGKSIHLTFENDMGKVCLTFRYHDNILFIEPEEIVWTHPRSAHATIALLTLITTDNIKEPRP